MLKSSTNTVIDLNNKSVKMYKINLWNVVGALHNPKDITTQTKVPHGVVKTVL